MRIGYLGLGKMGLNQCLRLQEKGNDVVAWNRSEKPRLEAERLGIATASTVEELVSSLEAPRTLWLMVPNAAVDEMLAALTPLLSPGDTIIDGGNTHFTETKRRAAELTVKDIHFLDAGVSGGPAGARSGACIMIGGEKADFEKLEPLFKDLAADGAYAHVGGHGAGHFVKMVHNGIEYGMMQAIAEGFEVLKKSEFSLSLKEAARIYNNRSVIESRLVGWLAEGFEKYGEGLVDITSTVAHTGEGEWTVKAAEELGIETPVIKASFEFRVKSSEKPTFAGKVLSTLRNMFGGHEAGENQNSKLKK
jgi:6-phosphogluconate dehydrogenase